MSFDPYKKYNIADVGKSENEEVKNLQAISEAVVKNKSKFLKFLQTEHSLIDNVKNVLTLGYPKKNQQYRMVTQKSFNALTFVLRILTDYGKIDECYITSYGMNINAINTFLDLLNQDKFGSIIFLLSEAIRKRSATIKHAITFENEIEKYDNAELIFAWNHTKIMLAKIGDIHFVL